MKETVYRGPDHMRTLGEWYWQEYLRNNNTAFITNYEGPNAGLYGQVFEVLGRSFLQRICRGWLQQQDMERRLIDPAQIRITTSKANKKMRHSFTPHEYNRNFPTPDALLGYYYENTFTLAALSELKIPDVRNLPKYQDQFWAYSDMIYYFRAKPARARQFVGDVLNIDTARIQIAEHLKLVYVLPLDCTADDICFTYGTEDYVSTLHFPLTADQIRSKINEVRAGI